jgi:hypothetical protein
MIVEGSKTIAMRKSNGCAKNVVVEVLSICVYVCERERYRETQKERQTKRET